MGLTSRVREHPGPGDIDGRRDAIDRIDRRIMDLLNERARYAKMIGQAKEARGLPVLTPWRERQVIDTLTALSHGPLPKGAVENIFAEIISACRAVQQPLPVAFLGPEATFTHQAAIKFFGRSGRYDPRPRIADVFDAVSRGQYQAGVVPMENSGEGGVRETMELLLDTDLTVCGEILTRVSHVLMALDNSIDAIERVYSHPQALAQCRFWLTANLGTARLIETASTTAAARETATRPKAAAIGSPLAAGRYGLEVLASDIQDDSHNMTRFLVIGRQECPPTGHDKTSVIFSLRHKPGTLHRALEALAGQGVNVTRIESRPIRGLPWEYSFFVDFEGHGREPAVMTALSELDDNVQWLKLLGSYPAANAPSFENDLQTAGGENG